MWLILEIFFKMNSKNKAGTCHKMLLPKICLIWWWLWNFGQKPTSCLFLLLQRSLLWINSAPTSSGFFGVTFICPKREAFGGHEEWVPWPISVGEKSGLCVCIFPVTALAIQCCPVALAGCFSFKQENSIFWDCLEAPPLLSQPRKLIDWMGLQWGPAHMAPCCHCGVKRKKENPPLPFSGHR